MAAAQGGNSSSDFVRKLYKMLEGGPEQNEIVCWGRNGDSFVVLDCERFTKTVLPKHFKHGNFASFVRQLNKYDFHKVRRPEEGGKPLYGPNAWEFKHPEFGSDRKDNLDSIRRKVTAPRKTQPTEEGAAPNTNYQLNLLSETLYATQQQVQQLQESYAEITQTNKLLVNEVVVLQKMLTAQKQAQYEMLSHLESGDRRDNRQSGMNGALSMFDNPMPGSELRRARDLLQSVSPDTNADRELERLYGTYSSPAGSDPSSVLYHTQVGTMPSLEDAKYAVYPAGSDQGIDPFHADHINNIPYAPETGSTPAHSHSMSPPASNQRYSEWGSRKPYVFLVEDDKICSKIGAKFLSSLGCDVELAKDGLDAVNRLNNNTGSAFDLIFMDIVMPKLDGVSATACIRDALPTTPIIAMTANIRQEDVSCYFDHGMNDVLAKPFTKEGMVRMLRKHLPHLLRQPHGDDPSSTNRSYGDLHGSATMAGTTMSAPAPINTSGIPIKFESTPSQSPATSASWHSPNQGAHTSPSASSIEGSAFVGVNNSGQLVINPQTGQRSNFTAANIPPSGARAGDLSNIDNRPEKRQRLYGPQGAFNQ